MWASCDSRMICYTIVIVNCKLFYRSIYTVLQLHVHSLRLNQVYKLHQEQRIGFGWYRLLFFAHLGCHHVQVIC